MDGQDFSRELRADAAGNFLDEIEKMYKAGETDAKIAADSRSNDTVPYVRADNDIKVPNMGAEDDVYVPNMGAEDMENKTVKYNIDGRLIYQDKYDGLSDSQKKALDAAVKEYYSKKRSGENYISFFDTYMKLVSMVNQKFDPQKYKTDRNFNDAFSQAVELLKKYHLDYENSTTEYSVKDQYKNEFKGLFDSVYKKMAAASANQPNVLQSSEDTKGQQDNHNQNTDLTTWKSTNDFYKDVLGSLSAERSKNDIIKSAYQTAYEYFSNSANIGKEIPKDVKSALNTFLQSVDNDTKVRILQESGLEGLKNKAKLPDGTYAKESTVITVGPYAGCTLTQGFNDTTNDKYRGHLGYDIGGENCNNIFPILDGEIFAIQADQYKYKNGKKIPIYDDEGKFTGEYEKHPDGVTVTIKHTNAQGEVYYSTYCHLAEGSVKDLKKGDIVTTKSIIGFKGDTGNSKGKPHLHLCVYTGDSTSNPIGYIDSVKRKLPFQNFDNYNVNSYFYPATDATWNRKFYDPYLVMITNGGLISLFPY